MNNSKKNFTDWINELNIRFYSTSRRKLEERDFHIRKLSAREFIRILKSSQFTFDNRNIFNKKLIAFSQKYEIKKEYIGRLLELRKDDYVKFKEKNKIQIGRYQGEINNGKDLVEIEVNGNGALNYIVIEKSKILFPTRKEISKTLKKELDAKAKRVTISLPESLSGNLSYLNYFDL